VQHVGVPPNQGSAPPAAHLLYTLGLAGDRRALPIWRRIVDLLATSTKEDLFDRFRAHYYYVSGVCYGAERLGDPEAIPILNKLHSYANLCGQVCRRGFQVDHLDERLGTLEIMIGRALARCGSPEGLATLIDYLQDVRASLAEHAHCELVAITGQDLSKDASARYRWLEEAAEALQPVPWIAPTEAMAAWPETILIEPTEDGR
jgi:hypothetical protein